MPRLATIGVYGFTGESFIATLRDESVTLVLDVRQRRGVRGAEYAWANAKRLQDALFQNDIRYDHRAELAPTTELRELQYEEDARQGVGKRSREQLAPAYVERYTSQILDPAPLEPVREKLEAAELGALLCVERDAAACHRSLIAARLGERFGFEVIDLEPPS
jgi:uncharacterized protein (DUF488 family)